MEDKNNTINQPIALDDDQRVKVLSPGMLVIKRFIRNRLAVIGLCIILFMVLFSFLGGVLMPYNQSQTFYTEHMISQEFAGVTVNDTYQYTVREGETLPAAARPGFIMAVNDGQPSFTSGGVTYFVAIEGDEFYSISNTVQLGSALAVGKNLRFNPADGKSVSQNVVDAMSAAIAADQNSFTVDGVNYYVERAGKTYQLSTGSAVAIASKQIFAMAEPGVTPSYEFKYSAQHALNAGEGEFEVGGVRYALEPDAEQTLADIYRADDGALYARMSHFLVQPTASDDFLTLPFKAAVEKAVEEDLTLFEYAEEGGEPATYELVRRNTQYIIRRNAMSKLLKEYAPPSSEHFMGTDEHGMDILTRLMYGGRISLTVGIVVVIIEIFIGVLLGGLAGYFGGWLDNLIMRVVDVFNCLPFMPLMIIFGSIMDQMRIDPIYIIYMMMVVMGVLYWPSTARMVRGQILSLREQEFMVAAEASGLSVSRRIFKHLVPNVIPQLVVIATMGLGNVILMESTLSFLGLGVKYPMASWGNIINSVNNVYVMANFWFAWIPAGMLILLTVLGINFIGDGLRDAFDPKMKR